MRARGERLHAQCTTKSRAQARGGAGQDIGTRDNRDTMFHVVLIEPQIPPNTGNVIRLCANTGAQLHLVEPLGFPIDHAKMRRAGLDYHEFVSVHVHASVEQWQKTQRPDPERIFVFSTRALHCYAQIAFRAGDWLVFGSETGGVPDALLQSVAPDHRLRLPMRAGNRSLNLSNAVAVAVYEAWRQNGFGVLGAEQS